MANRQVSWRFANASGREFRFESRRPACHPAKSAELSRTTAYRSIRLSGRQPFNPNVCSHTFGRTIPELIRSKRFFIRDVTGTFAAPDICFSRPGLPDRTIGRLDSYPVDRHQSLECDSGSTGKRFFAPNEFGFDELIPVT